MSDSMISQFHRSLLSLTISCVVGGCEVSQTGGSLTGDPAATEDQVPAKWHGRNFGYTGQEAFCIEGADIGTLGQKDTQTLRKYALHFGMCMQRNDLKKKVLQELVSRADGQAEYELARQLWFEDTGNIEQVRLLLKSSILHGYEDAKFELRETEEQYDREVRKSRMGSKYSPPPHSTPNSNR